jgi:hypothetical protein
VATWRCVQILLNYTHVQRVDRAGSMTVLALPVGVDPEVVSAYVRAVLYGREQALAVNRELCADDLRAWAERLAAPRESRPLRVSPSSAKKFRCPRQWAFKTIDRVPEPQGQSAALGEATHAELERYLRGGALPDTRTDAGQLAALIVPILPRGQVLGVERQMTCKSGISGASYHGLIDLLWDERRRVGVADHKTTSNIKAYALTPERLLDDEQSLIYAAFVLEEHPAQDYVPVQWNYVQTKSARRALPVRAEIPRERARAALAVLDETVVRPMQQILASARCAAEVEPNPSACGDYGGCPHRRYCPLTNEERIKGALESMSTSQHPTIWEQLQSKHTAPGAPAIPAGPYDGINRPPGEVPHGQAPAQSAPVQAAQAGPIAQSAPVQAAPIAGLPSWLTLGAAPAQGVIVEMTAQAPQVIVPPRLAEMAQAPAPAPIAMSAPMSTVSDTFFQPSQVEPDKEPAQIQAAPSTPPAPVEPVPTPEPDRPATIPAGRGRGFVLLDGCTGIGNPPWGGQLVRAAPLLRTAAARAAQALAVPDYRMADYGKGAGAFVAMLEQTLDESGPREGDMVVLDLGPESDHARATLQARASYTIRGTR